MLSFHTAGESHGQALITLVEGIPAHLAVDFEFTALPGCRQVPVCCVAHELRSGRRFRIFQDQFGSAPPYASGSDVLFIGSVTDIPQDV